METSHLMTELDTDGGSHMHKKTIYSQRHSCTKKQLKHSGGWRSKIEFISYGTHPDVYCYNNEKGSARREGGSSDSASSVQLFVFMKTPRCPSFTLAMVLVSSLHCPFSPPNADCPTLCAWRQQKRAFKMFRPRGFFGEDLDPKTEEGTKQKTVTIT